MDLRSDGIPRTRRRDGSAAWRWRPGRVLSNRAGAGLDPCAALQTRVRLGAAGTTEIVFFLGQSPSGPEAQALVAKYRKADLDAVFAAVTQQWEDTLGVVQVKTPDRAMDILLNRWLPYQTLACRVWARTGFYQASGAYGFRDQLQDVMALCRIAARHRARAHACRRCAAVRRRRRPALVVAGIRARRPHACLRRSRLAGLCRVHTISGHRRLSLCWTRRCLFSKGPC